MGNRTSPPVRDGSDDEDGDGDGDGERLGDLLAGRLADVSVDSVRAVRDARERE